MTTVLPKEGSAYPRPVQELVPLARVLVDESGTLPSRNQLMREFKIGKDKAKAILEILADVNGPDIEPTPDPWAYAEPTPADGTQSVGTLSTGSATVADLPQSESTHRDEPLPLVAVAADPKPDPEPVRESATPSTVRKPVRAWPVLLLALPAMIAIWSGWVGLGGLTGFGVVHPLPGILDGFTINSAITLPVGIECYGAYALRVWLSGAVPARARRFARWSAIGSLACGALGQVAFHLMAAAHVTAAPWPVTCAVACFPVAVLGLGAALAHLIRESN